MSMKDLIKQKLENQFHPLHLEVVDQSHLHAAHFFEGPPIETHFKIIMMAPSLKGMNPLKKHKAVYDALGDELKSVHSITLDLRER